MDKKFAVVYLPSEDIYSEVPTNWLTENGTKCWWPKTINARIQMKRGDKPDIHNWNCHDVKIETYCSTLEGARKRAEDPEYSTSNEIEATGRGMRKKKLINRYKSSDSEDTMTPPPSPQKIIIQSDELIVHQEATPINVESDIPIIFIEDKTTTSTSSFADEYGKTTSATCGHSSSSGTDEYGKTSSRDSFLTPPATDGTLEDLSIQIARLKSICLVTQKYVKDINEQLKSIAQKDGEWAIDNHMNLINGKIPLKTIEDLKEFNAELEALEEIKKSFINHIKAIGGRDGKDHLYRCLSQIFTNDLATHCSWYGQRGNFKLNNLKIMNIIADIILCQYKNTMTMNDIEKFCGEWFRLSKQRLVREKKHS